MQKKIIKISSIIFILVISYIFYEMTSISTKIINRDLITVNLNNIRNPQIKKVMRYLDNQYASLLLKVSKNAKLYYDNTDERESFSQTKIIKKTNNFSSNLYPLENNGKNWTRNYAGHSSNRFSSLKKINKNNINKLSVAWKYKISDKGIYDIQSNAIVADNKIYIPSYDKKIICLDAKSGKLLWDFTLYDGAPRRGMVYLNKKSN